MARYSPQHGTAHGMACVSTALIDMTAGPVLSKKLWHGTKHILSTAWAQARMGLALTISSCVIAASGILI